MLGALLAGGVYVLAQQPNNLIQVGGTAIALGQTTMAASIPVAIASNQGAYPIKLEDGSGNAITSTSSALDINIKSGGSAVDANNYALTSNAATATATAAATACNILSAASTNATSCKASAGNFYGFDIFNTTTTIYYLRLYNLATAPTCSSATGFIRSIPIPPAAAAGGAGGAVSNQGVGVNYGTGIAYCITGGSASTDNTNAATGIFGEIRYK